MTSVADGLPCAPALPCAPLTPCLSPLLQLSALLERERNGHVLSKVERLRKKVLFEQFNMGVK